MQRSHQAEGGDKCSQSEAADGALARKVVAKRDRKHRELRFRRVRVPGGSHEAPPVVFQLSAWEVAGDRAAAQATTSLQLPVHSARPRRQAAALAEPCWPRGSAPGGEPRGGCPFVTREARLEATRAATKAATGAAAKRTVLFTQQSAAMRGARRAHTRCPRANGAVPTPCRPGQCCSCRSSCRSCSDTRSNTSQEKRAAAQSAAARADADA